MKKLRRMLFIVFTWILAITSLAQQQRIDSLKSLLLGKQDSVRTKILYELAYEYVDFNDSLGAIYGARSFECAKQIGDSLGMVKAARIRATAFRRLEKLDAGIALARAILPIAKRNNYQAEINQLLRGMALAHTYKATYDSGLYYNLEILRMTEQTQDSIERSFAFTNIGLIYYKLANFKKALHYYEQALAVANRESSVNKLHIANTFLNISLCYSNRRDFLKARESLKKGIDYYGSGVLAAFDMQSLQVAGLFFYMKGDLDSAEVSYLRSYSVARKLGNKRFQLILLSNLVAIYLTKGQLSLATKYLTEAESAMQCMAFKVELANMYLDLQAFCKRNANVKGLVFYQKRYIQINDIIHSRTSKNNLIKIEGEYLERKNKARIIEQEQLLSLHGEVIARQNALNISACVVSGLLALLLYILYKNNAEKKLTSQFLEQRVRERTATLEQSHLLLKTSSSVKDAMIIKTQEAVKQYMATLSGLCNVGLTGKGAFPTRGHFQQLTNITTNVLLVLGSVADKNCYDLRQCIIDNQCPCVSKNDAYSFDIDRIDGCICPTAKDRFIESTVTR